MVYPSTRVQSVSLLGSRLSCCSFDDILHGMAETIRNRRQGYISITNTESIYHATRIPEHQEYINGADYSCCDGVAAVMAGKLLGLTIPRLHGPDLMDQCCTFGVALNWRHFFYGGKCGIPELLSEKLTARHPGMITVGTYSPPFREMTACEDRKIINIIQEADPDIIWVGLGLLKQERWIAEHRSLLSAGWMVGVGAAFDFHTDTVKRAPKIYRTFGLEWLYRVIFEPRMIKRNIYSAKIFPRVIRESISRLNQNN